MNRARTITTITLAVVACFRASSAVAQLDDKTWVGGTGNQLWQVDANWQLNALATTFPNDPGRVDSDPVVITNSLGANLSVNLAANLNVDVGATNVTVAALTLGSTSGAVTTNVTSSGGQLVFENFEQNSTTPVACAFNCGAALITSQGVAGATNVISTPVLLNDEVQVAGTNNLTISGSLVENAVSGFGSLNAMPAGMTVFVTGNMTTVDDLSAEDVPIALNVNSANHGTIDVTGVISGPGRMQYGTGASAPTMPLGTVILHAANTYTGRTNMARGYLVLDNDSALGTGTMKESGSAEGSLQTGYNIVSTDDSRVIANQRSIAQWLTIKGEHSLEWAGLTYQDNRRGWINMLPAGKVFKLSGDQHPNHTEENPNGPARDITFDGTGRTVISGNLHNAWSTVQQQINIGPNAGSFRFRGTGTFVLSGTGSTYTGITQIEGANVHFATNASFGGTARFVSEAGAVGVDAGVVGNATFLGALNNSSSPEADAAGLNVVYDRGGLMLANGEYGANLDFTGAMASAGDMSLAAQETGSTYTGTITPRSNTYRLGGGSGTLTLPNANQLTGAGNVVATNGGVVNITGSNNYSGTTSLIAKFVTSLQNAAAADTISFTATSNIPNDQMYVGTTLAATTLADGGAASSIGSSTNAASNLYIQGSTLKYVGAAASTNRLFTIGTNGATIDASGSGAISFTNTAALGVGVAAARTGNVNAFATGNTANDRSTIRNLSSTQDLAVGMPISSPGQPTSGSSAGILPGTTITRIISATDVGISQQVGDFAFYNNTSITFGAAPERKLTLTGSNSGNNTLASLVGNASDGGVVGVTKNGGGKWILTGNNTYTGTTTVNAGTLLVNGTQTGAGLTTVAAGATLGGTGTLGGAITNNGTIGPGASVGTLNVNGNVTMGASSHYAVELSGATADKLAITGNLDLAALANFLDVTGTGTGSSWVIATYTGTLTGVFETITSGYTVDYGSGTNSQVTLMAAGLPGDFNSDGKVDAGDYVTWRKNNGTSNALANDNSLGTPIGPAHYALWRSNFGKPPGAGSGLGAGAVPEPSGVLIVVLLMGAAIGMVRRRD